jgi:hypothetical protein
VRKKMVEKYALLPNDVLVEKAQDDEET